MKSKFIGTNQFSGKPLDARFWEKVDVRSIDECWEWRGSRHHKWGYGHFRLNGKVESAHRVSWQMMNGDIPDGLVVCHNCDNPPCCNPKHLFLGTIADNNLDKKIKGRQDEKGEKNGRAVLKSENIVYIRKQRKLGVSGAELGRMFNVTKENIYDICSGKRWSHIKEGL